MSVRRIVLLAVSIAVPGAVIAALVWGGRAGHGTWNSDALRATLERVVPAHNDAYFIYVLENRTDADYRIGSESEVQLVGRSKSTGDLVAKAGAHLSGEFPLRVPARRKVHFALVWTANQDLDPAGIDNFARSLNLRSFVLFDKIRRYQIEFPGRR